MDTALPPAARDFDLVLLLSGGNALASYQAGAYAALERRGWNPDWVVGASAGAINGAIIGGNLAENRLARLRAFWRLSEDQESSQPADSLEEARRTWSAAMTMMRGEPGLFVPRSLYGPWWHSLGNPEPASLYDALPLQATLHRLIDFGLLNKGPVRFSATAVDIETGEDICFDTARSEITAKHLRASAALLPAFSPVEVDGRLLGDAGISINLPLDVVLSEVRSRPLVCIALDLLPLRAPRPATLGETVSRSQDLIFATQSRRAIAAWQAIFAERARQADCPTIELVHVTYSGQELEVSGKAFDFSARSAAKRWRSGAADMTFVLGELANGRLATGQPGLSVHALESGPDGPRRLEKVDWRLSPIRQ